MKIWILILVVGIFLLLDWYVYRGIRQLTTTISSVWIRNGISLIYWIVVIGVKLSVWITFSNQKLLIDPQGYIYVYHVFGLVLLVVLPQLVFTAFLLITDMHQRIYWIIKRFSSRQNLAGTLDGEVISRGNFITQLGAAAAIIPLSGVAYGILVGRYNFKVTHQKLSFPHLPSSFNGLKVVHISDIHIGSFFGNQEAVMRGIRLINSLHADVILFTGDMVNHYAVELDGWEDAFKELNAPMGKYSIMGNHDYGDYVPWENSSAKKENIQNLQEKQKSLGFRLLLNENVQLEKDGQGIELIGVENWGKPPFSQYGNLTKALDGTDPDNFQILMSHDPSHWDAEVLENTAIDLCLSGHTHGMQFGVQIGTWQWSPVKMKYPRWGGLYSEGNQHLYVNRGFGYIGYPGRVGMPPEITCIELNCT